MSKELLLQRQLETEAMYSRKGIKQAILDYMATIPECEEVIDQGVMLLKMWCESESDYESKKTRKAHISQMDLRELVIDVFVRITSQTSETTLNNLASQLAPIMGFDDTRVGIQAMAEVLAILTDTQFYDLVKPHINSSIYVRCKFYLPDDLQAYVERACYLPPLLVKPKKLRGNRDSGYLSVKGESLILGGSHNHHNDPISLDVLNIMNAYRLTLNEWMIDNVIEEPTHDLDTLDPDKAQGLTEIEMNKAIAQQKTNWLRHLEQSAIFYQHIRDNGNLMYITNKPDKRGRFYSQGYHINPQGTSYKKACVDLYDKEIVEIPDAFFG